MNPDPLYAKIETVLLIASLIYIASYAFLFLFDGLNGSGSQTWSGAESDDEEDEDDDPMIFAVCPRCHADTVHPVVDSIPGGAIVMCTKCQGTWLEDEAAVV